MAYVNTNASISDAELQMMLYLRLCILSDRFHLDLVDDYYKGEMVVRDLGISIPPELRHLRAVIGWPAVVVDSLDERMDVEGFRYSGDASADMDLWDIWQDNGLDFESGLVHLDSLVFGRSFVTVGAPDTPGDSAVICGETPRGFAVHRDPRTRKVMAAFRLYVPEELEMDGPMPPEDPMERFGTLYLPNSTIHLQEGGNGSAGWTVLDRDDHDLGEVPVVEFRNASRTGQRFGFSQITPAVMNITDNACRTALGMEVAREFFAAPQRYILGAGKDSFVNADGTPKTAWQTYLGRVLALMPSSDGQPMGAGTFAAGDPTTFTNVLKTLAEVMASTTGLPGDYFSLNTTIPASADAIRMGTDRMVKKVQRKQKHMGHEWENVMRLAVLIQHGEKPEGRLETIWRNPEIPTIASTATALLQYVEAGIAPATAGPILDRAGFSAIEQEQISQERLKQQGDALVTALAAAATGAPGAPGAPAAAAAAPGQNPQAQAQAAAAQAAGIPHMLRANTGRQLIESNDKQLAAGQ